MKCNDCGYNDRYEDFDKCPKCGGDDWIDAPVKTPNSIAKKIVSEWMLDRGFIGVAIKNHDDLIKRIANAIKEDRR